MGHDISDKLETLNFSYDFYKNLLPRAIDFYTFNFDNSKIADAAKHIAKQINNQLIATMFREYKTLSSKSDIAVEIDWSQYLCYFDLLDYLILKPSAPDEWVTSALLIQSNCTTQEFAHCAVMKQSFRKLRLIAKNIVFQIYKDEPKMTHLAQIPMQSKDNAGFIDDDLAYNYLFANVEKEVLQDFVDFDNKCEDFHNSAKFYLNAALSQTTILREKYKTTINNYLHYLWYGSYTDRLSIVYRIKETMATQWALRSLNGIEFDDFFLLCEWFAYRMQYPTVKTMAKIGLRAKEHTNGIVSTMVPGFGEEIDQEVRTLNCYLVQLEAVLAEYLLYRCYVLTGKKLDLGDLSLGTTIESSGAKFLLQY